MSNTWNTMGYAYHNNGSLSSSLAVLAVTADLTNSKLSSSIPRNCFIDSVEIFLTGMSTGGSTPTEVTLYLSRDSTGDVAVTPGGTTGATQTIGAGVTTNTGSVVFQIESDFNFDSDVSGSTAGTLYAAVKLDTGTATGDIRINYRGM